VIKKYRSGFSLQILMSLFLEVQSFYASIHTSYLLIDLSVLQNLDTTDTFRAHAPGLKFRALENYNHQ